MISSLDPLKIRKKLGRDIWEVPEPFSYNGWNFEHKFELGRIFVDIREDLEVPWIHASISFKNRLPTYDEIKLMYIAIFEGQWAYQVFAPGEEHISFAHNALHLWGREDGKPALPDFSGDSIFGKMI